MKKLRKILKRGVVCIIVLGVLFIANILLFGKDPIVFSDVQKDYIGVWEAKNNEKSITLTIDETGYMKYLVDYGNSNTSLSGPITTLDEGIMKVSLGILSKTYEVSDPVKETDGWTLIVEGNTLHKKFGPDNVAVPEASDLNDLLSDTFQDMSKGIEKESLEDFFSNTSKLFQLQVDIEALNTFIEYNTLVKDETGVPLYDIILSDFTISENPYLGNYGELVVKGKFISNPIMYFENKYVYEYPSWKLLSINVGAEKY